MARNGGAIIDTARRQVRDRNGITYPLDAVVTSEHGLYYTRPIEGNELFWYHERWLLPKHALAVSRMAFHPHRADAVDWYIETDLTEVCGDMWSVRDGYLDVYVHEGLRYDLEDAGELADAIVHNELPLSDALEALRALDLLCNALRTNGCSGHALLTQLAPSLPASSIARSPDGVFSILA